MNTATVLVIGDVGHGKSTLIQALVAEGLQSSSKTILPDGSYASIREIPEGTASIDYVIRLAFHTDVALVVVDSTVGVTAALREKVAALRSVGILSGAIAITKCDIAIREEMERVESEVAVLASSSGSQHLPEIRTSAVTGRGINALKRSILAAIRRTPVRTSLEPPRFIVDRITNQEGSITSAQITLQSCNLNVGDKAENPITGEWLEVAGIELDGKRTQTAGPGTQPTVMLEGQISTPLEKGIELAAPGALRAASNVTVELTPTFSNPKTLDEPSSLMDGESVVVHTGGLPQSASLSLIEPSSDEPTSDATLLRLNIEQPFVFCPGDHVVIRRDSKETSFLFGRLLAEAPSSVQHTELPGDGPEIPTVLRTVTESILSRLYRAPMGAVRKGLLDSEAPDETAVTTTAITELETAGLLFRIGGGLLMHRVWHDVQTHRILYALDQYHQRFPNRPGMPTRDLSDCLGDQTDAHAFRNLIGYLERLGKLVTEGDVSRASDFRAALNPRQIALLERIEEEYRLCGASGMPTNQIAKLVKAPPNAVESLILKGVERGTLIVVGEGAYWHIDTIAKIQAVIRDYIETHGGITASELRDRLNSNRNAAVAALEYSDRVGFTVREGDIRKLAPDYNS